MTNKVLKFNDSNDNVQELHNRLRKLQYPVNNFSSYFDKKTESFVKSFQNDNNLNTTGIVDDVTWEVLYKQTNPITLKECELFNESTITGTYDELTQEVTLIETDTMPNDNIITKESDDKQLVSHAPEEYIKKEVDFPFELAHKITSSRNEDEEAISETATIVPSLITRGAFGPSVIELQSKLLKLGYIIHEPDGVLGPITENAIKEFQQSNRLLPDGIVGVETSNQLDKSFYAIERTSNWNKVIIKTGSKGSDVELLQHLLKALHFFPGKIDSIFGPLTENAVKDFQSANGLSVDGTVGPATWGKMQKIINPDEVEFSLLKENNTGKEVTILQSQLKKLGFFPGSITGSFGPETNLSVKNFQRKSGLKVDGIVGPKTWEKLFIQNTIPAPILTGSSQKNPVIKVGYKGPYVKELQKILKSLTYYDGPISEVFDDVTKIGVKAFQLNNKLTPDGIVGLHTWS
ncbi:MAG: peptidoglycan-binding protein, partial [Clostridia bacterium]|nr:peptidoglycan-binding protein [Clostridia bacterium]